MAKLMAGNWKMFKGPVETLAFFDAFEAPDGVDVVLCPPFVSLEARSARSGRSTRRTSTGRRRARSPERSRRAMLVEIGVKAPSSATPSVVSTSAKPTRPSSAAREAALEAGLGVIACVGETEAEREAGETEAVLAARCGAAAARRARDRLRARVGDRHGQDRDPRASPRRRTS